MTYMLVGALAAAIGLAAMLGGALVWAVRKVSSFGEKRVTSAEKAAKAEAETARWQNHVDQLDQVIKAKNAAIDSEVAARKRVEEQRDRAIKRLSETGDPAAVADALRLDLNRLQDLSEVSDLPPGTIATAPGGNED